MASVVPGYEYDIFISYRQKDNKYDGWVTEFVTNLKTELEATLKDEISVYFDINPHDGLLETHEVDASLKEKLRCLIFIPIISQTYCDPKSFAWQSEFCAFNKLAKEDQLGRNIRITGGNVASRILPVKIHELDPEDISLIENELGGSLRGIEFIFKSAGVNRPLRANEDHPQENLNKTYYRDQINKTANAIKEILNALNKPQSPFTGSPEEILKGGVLPTKKLKSKIVAGSLLALGVILLGYFIIPKINVKDNQLEKSIAVLPFVNDSPGEENAYFINGIMAEILNNLQKIKDFRVLSRTSTAQFKGDNMPTIPEIAKKLEVNYLVEGSGQKYGNTLHLNVKLIAAENEKYLWVHSFDQEIRETKDIFDIQSQVARTIAAKLQAIITPEEKKLIEKTSTVNLTAYDFCQRGEEEIAKHPWPEYNSASLKKAEVYFRKALEYDSGYARAYYGLSGILWVKRDRDTTISGSDIRYKYEDSMLVLADKALTYDKQLAEAYIVRGAYFHYKNDFNKAVGELDKAIKYKPNESWAYARKGWYYSEYDILKSLQNYQMAASLDHGSALGFLLNTIGNEYFQAGFPEKGREYYLEALKLDGDSLAYSDQLIMYTAGIQGDYKRLIEYFERRNLTDTANLDLFAHLCYGYTFLGQFAEALKYIKKYVSVSKASRQTDLPPNQHVGFVYLQNGHREEAEYYWEREVASYNKEIISGFPEWNSFWYYQLASVYSCQGDKTRAYENLKNFSQHATYPLVFVNLLRNDPTFNNIRNEPEFQKIFRDVQAKYQVLHKGVRKWLEEQGENPL